MATATRMDTGEPRTTRPACQRTFRPSTGFAARARRQPRVRRPGRRHTGTPPGESRGRGRPRERTGSFPPHEGPVPVRIRPAAGSGRVRGAFGRRGTAHPVWARRRSRGNPVAETDSETTAATGAAPALSCCDFPAMTYFPTPSPEQYRRRWGVSLPCSGWERVGPPRLNHQKVNAANYAPFPAVWQGAFAGNFFRPRTLPSTPPGMPPPQSAMPPAPAILCYNDDDDRHML